MQTPGWRGDAVVPDTFGWLLSLRAGDRLARATDVRMTSHVASPHGWDLTTRRLVAAAAREGAAAVVGGERVRERLAERRWLAWFPRPVGPRHAVNIGGASIDLLAVLPGVRLVRRHLTSSSWMAELLQAMANLAGSSFADGLLDRWVERGRRVDDADVRWACVVEVADDDGHLVRAWAHGWAPVATGSELDAALATTASVVDADDARHLLDQLAASCGLRWSLTGPDSR